MQVLQYLIIKIIIKKFILKHLEEMQIYGFKTINHLHAEMNYMHPKYPKLPTKTSQGP